DADVGAGVGLLAAQTREPAVQVAELVAQREDLADGAAKVGIALPQLRPVDVGLLGYGNIRFQGFDGQAEEILEALLEGKRLGKKQAGIQGEDRERQMILPGEVNHDESGALKAGADGRARAKTLPGPGENVL